MALEAGFSAGESQHQPDLCSDFSIRPTPRVKTRNAPEVLALGTWGWQRGGHSTAFSLRRHHHASPAGGHRRPSVCYPGGDEHLG